MTHHERKARKSWLLSLGDLVTLLICFFIMTLVLNKGDVKQVHQWIDGQIERSYQSLNASLAESFSSGVALSRDNEGILITINTPDAFESAKTQPSPQLTELVKQIALLLPQLPIIQVEQNYPELIHSMQQAGLNWYTDIIVEGHTDNDAIAATSPLRNNWQLSALRAQSVMMLLQNESNLPPERFSLAGKGEHAPIVDNDTAEHKAQNRRIQIRINAAMLKSKPSS
ncbi:MAG: flagellar motor protein MotB [Gammaproteobacteria bacterium]|nr:flagellar motor protein MotB [Gammaproteobacteria bacterium]